MNKETIEKAADEFANREYETSVVDRDYLHKGFYHGAHWRINSVWHNTYDIAEPGKHCLVEYMDGDGSVYIRIDWRSEYEWVNACHYDKILRWAYVDDLVPDGKPTENAENFQRNSADFPRKFRECRKTSSGGKEAEQ